MDIRTISSGGTFGAKFLLPCAFVLILTYKNVINWSANHPILNTGIATADTKYVFLGFSVLFIIFSIWLCIGLKRVRVDREHLYVSDYRNEIKVPLSNIREIGVPPLSGAMRSTVTIYLNERTLFGDTIVFIPKGLPFPSSGRRSAEELRKLAHLP